MDLETAMLDLTLCKIKYAAYSYEYQWKKYIREN